MFNVLSMIKVKKRRINDLQNKIENPSSSLEIQIYFSRMCLQHFNLIEYVMVG